MTFAHPQFLWLLALPAALLLAAAFARARAKVSTHPKIPRASFRHSSLVIGHSTFQRRPIAACLALAFLALALARPQGGTISTPSVLQARDVLVAVDVSRSMLADDVAPNRLARARLLVRALADDLRGERLGLLPFAGTAFLQSPLSADYEIFQTFLDELGPEMIPAGGSNFAALLRTADEAFGPADSTAPGAPTRPDRYLVILSDGEAEDDAWRPLAEKLSERGVRILSLGLGTPGGAMVPDGKGGLTKDERGAAVLSRLNPATLQDLARLTDGAYRDASAWVDLPALLKETISRGRASRVTTDTAPRRQELFVWFLAPALVLLALSLAREFPAIPRVSAPALRRSAPPPLPGAVVRLVPLALVLHWSLVIGPWSFAAPAASPAAAPAPDPLQSLVEKLAAAPNLSASDLARLATLTADQGEAARANPQPHSAAPFPEGALRDALAAVSAGQTADSRAADWPALRKRLDTLLAPPPEPPKSDENKPDQQPKSDQQKSPEDQKSDDKSEQPSPSSPPPGDPKDKQKSPSSDADSSPSSGSPSAPQDGKSGSPDAGAPKPSNEKPLGDLADPSKKPDDKSEEKAPAPTDRPAPENADEPTQQAGGVSASGRPADASEGQNAPPLDAALAVPQQRLERVRDADAPARLFQLLQESETPPEERERRAAGSKQNW